MDAVHSLTQTYEASPGSVAEARARLAGFAEAAGATANQVDAVRLATSEAMTNCVVHAYRGDPGEIHLNAGVISGELWILISDDGEGLAPQADRSGLGLGLGLISQVSDDFAVVSRANGGTEVRIRFTLADVEPRPSDTRPSSTGRPAAERRGGITPSMSLG